MNSRKQLDIELMRILAAFFVIFNHTGNNGYFLFSLYPMQSFPFWIYLFLSIFCTFSVPLFFMITGALMLNREPEPLKDLWEHRVLKMVRILLFWSLLYYFASVCRGTQKFGVKEFAAVFYDSSWNYSFWYLYAYIPLLISLPLLQKFAKGLSNKDYIYMIALFFTFSSLLPTMQYLLWQDQHNLNENFRLGWICTGTLFYPCLGYFLQHRAKDYWNKKRLAILWAVNIAAILLACCMTYLKANATGVCDEVNSEAFHSTFVAVNCASIFVSCQYFVQHVKINERIQRMILSVGGCSFGIYLLHVLFMEIPGIKKLLDVFRDQWNWNDMVSGLLYCACIFLMGYLTTLLLKRIPLMKKLIS